MATEPTTQPVDQHRDWRVILAGRTGLDSELRFDPRMELVRVRTAIEAIGELSDPIDADSPQGAVVVVGPDADPGSISGDAAREFVDALRRVDPSVRVLRARPGLSAEPMTQPSPYDGELPPGAAADAILDVGNTHEPPTITLDSPEPDATVAPNEAALDDALASIEPEEPTRTPPADAGDPGDLTLVRLMLEGADPLAEALALLRMRTGLDDVRFVERGDRLEPQDPEGVPVTRRGVTLGWLQADGADESRLEGHAPWLAHWLVLRDQHAQLRRAAFMDPLTGAWNRRYLDRFLGSVLDRAKSERRTVTVMVFDIDDFKTFNDEFSHAAGDEILIHTVKMLQSVIRPTDRVCRIGGDEFVVIFYEPTGPRAPGSAPPSSVFEIARRFQRQICEHRFPKLGDQAPGTLTISGGLATFPWDGRTPEELIEAADELALKSKRQGKNALTLGPGAARICDVLGQ